MDVILWNMIVGKCKKLPNSHLTHLYRDSYSHVVVGFGFVLETNDFKVVQIMYDGDSDDFPDVWVYSVEFNTWRKIEAIAPCSMTRFSSSNVYVNGAVHWLACKNYVI